MRILYLIETGGHGGSETVLSILCDHFRSSGHEVCVGLLEPGWLADTLSDDEVDNHLLFQGKEIAGVDLQTLWSVYKLIRDFRPDVLHTFLFHMNFYGSISGALQGVPAIVSLRSKHYDFEKPQRRLAWKLINKLAAQITTASDDLAEVLHTRCGVARHRILSIPNGVDTARYSALYDKAAIKRELGLPEDAKVVGTVGRMNPVKGHEDLVYAAKILRDSGTDLTYLIVGATEEPVFTNLTRLCEQFDLGSRFIFPGIRSDVPKWLQAMDCFVLPSHSEGMSNALLEAMACGLPIVATDVGSNSQLLDDGECGIIVPPRSPQRLAAAIGTLTASEDAAQRYGEAAFKRVKERYSQDRMLETYNSLYERLCQKRKKG